MEDSDHTAAEEQQKGEANASAEEAEETAGAETAEAEEEADLAHRSRRIQAHFETEFVGKQVEGSGTVRNISLTGALIENCSALLIGGGDVRLTFSFFEGSLPVTVRAKTVRETESGFAVRFVGMQPRVKAILSQAITRAEREQPKPSSEDPSPKKGALFSNRS